MKAFIAYFLLLVSVLSIHANPGYQHGGFIGQISSQQGSRYLPPVIQQPPEGDAEVIGSIGQSSPQGWASNGGGWQQQQQQQQNVYRPRW